MNVKDLLIRICEESSVSGFESPAVASIAREFGNYCDEVLTDISGNLIAMKKGSGSTRIMFAAHMDEIGLMVTDIDEHGYVKFTVLGGIDQRTLLAQEVIIHGSEEVFGVIGHKPPHLCTADDMKKAVKSEDMAIDTGYSYEKIKTLVKLGDVISINRSVIQLQNDRMSGKALDNMAGVAVLLVAMDRLKDYHHAAELYFVATVQEEVGKLGATTAAYHINPDIGIAVDVYFAKTPDIAEGDALELGKGPGIAIGPNIHPRIYEKLKDCAKDNHTDHQIYVLPRPAGTDATAIQISRDGVATGVLSIPLKYMHTSVETISIDDIMQTGKLLADFVISLNGCDMEAVLCY